MLREVIGLLVSPSSQGSGSREHLARPGVWAPCETGQARTSTQNSSPQVTPRSGLEVSFLARLQAPSLLTAFTGLGPGSCSPFSAPWPKPGFF